MKIEVSLDELALIVSALGDTHHAFRALARIEPSGSFNALVASKHAAACAELEDRLNNQLEAAEHAERFLDDME